MCFLAPTGDIRPYKVERIETRLPCLKNQQLKERFAEYFVLLQNNRCQLKNLHSLAGLYLHCRGYLVSEGHHRLVILCGSKNKAPEVISTIRRFLVTTQPT